MSRLLLDTFLILLGSFFLGCIVACGFRRAFFSGSTAPDVATDGSAALRDPAPATAGSGSDHSARFDRALGEATAPRPAAVASGAPMIEVDPVAPKLGQAPSAPPSPVQPVAPAASAVRPAQAAAAAAALAPAVAAAEAARFDRALSGQATGAAQPASAPAARPAPPPPPPAVAQVEPRTAAAPAPTSAPSAAPAQAAAAATIAAIAAASAAAAPKPAPASVPRGEVATTAEDLARLIAFSNQPAVVQPKPAVPPVLTGTPAAAIAATAAAEQPTTPGDDLKRIRAIDAELEARLNRLGVRRFADIAAWKANDVVRMSQSLGFAGRIEQENWIEQAQILSKGSDTDFSRRQLADEERPPVSITSLPTGGDQTTIAAIAAAAAAGIAAAPKAPAPAAAPAVQPSPAPAPVHAVGGDRLHRILGVNGEAERVLHEHGVTRYAQIAAWSPEDVDRFDQLLGKPGRVGRENWIEQAKLLAQSGEELGTSAAATAPAVVQDNSPRGTRSDVGTLRSVKSEALRAQSPANDPGRPSVLTRSVGFSDDLKRIRGVGVLIEKKLNSLGVTNYEQVANWTGADIDRISQILDFKGRIERENWIEQARILAAGGQTEFSRRVDRGEVDSSKPAR